MPKYLVNEAAVAKAEELIEARRYVVRSEWSEVQPSRCVGERLPGSQRLGGLLTLAPRVDGRCPGRDQGPLCLRVR